eukprot:SAG31_NODE_15771_length_739_cov_1.328125_1_plen_99_part_01
MLKDFAGVWQRSRGWAGASNPGLRFVRAVHAHFRGALRCSGLQFGDTRSPHNNNNNFLMLLLSLFVFGFGAIVRTVQFLNTRRITAWILASVTASHDAV